MTQQLPPNPFVDDDIADIPDIAVSVDNESINKGHFTPPPIEEKLEPTPKINQQNTPVQEVVSQQVEEIVQNEPQSPQQIVLPPKLAYHIVDLYWLPNWRFYENQTIPENEPGLVVLSYNATFQNLRVAFRKTTDQSFTESSIILNNTPKITTINLFSETAEQIFYYLNLRNDMRPHEITIPVVERLWKPQPGWTPNISRIILLLKSKHIRLITIEDNTKEEYNYIFGGWQYNAFLNSLKILINGNSWLQSMNVTTIQQQE